MALKDPAAAAGNDIQRLYEQGASISAIAYLLFGAAEPFSKALGSSAALLPYLSPTVLRLYSSQPQRCSSDLVGSLYYLSTKLYGTPSLMACHYSLYTALGSTFAWVRDNIALRLQELPDQPLASAAWPDTSLYSDRKLAAAVADALAHPDKLGETAELLAGSCGLAAGDFAALVPPISAVLQRLHADLQLLQTVGQQLLKSHWTLSSESDNSSEDSISETAAAPNGFRSDDHLSANPTSPQSRRRLVSREGPRQPDGSVLSAEAAHAAASDPRVASTPGPTRTSATAAAAARRRWTAAADDVNGSSSGDDSSAFFYSMPPDGFVAAPPAALPPLLVPLVFHVMLYTDRNGAIAPALSYQAPAFVDRLVRVANLMARPTNFQLFVKEVRNDPTVYPYLLLPDRISWLLCPGGGVSGYSCLRNQTFVSDTVADFPRSINVFLVSDSTVLLNLPLGYGWIPGSDVEPAYGHVYMTWDGVSTSGSNSLPAYNDGPNTLLHEVFHHLGLQHTFNAPSGSFGIDAQRCTADGDYVVDTPTTLGSVGSSSFAATATSYCMELFWGRYGGDWNATYTRWRSMLGIPEADMNAWADTCPSKAGYDELGNYMTYNTPVCFAALGHFTAAQAQRAHYVTAELNPVMYAWGQYYAQNSKPPPPMASPPPEAYNDTCKVSRGGCACKAAWSLNGNSYSFCDRPLNSSDTLYCEVLNPATCTACRAVAAGSQCVTICAVTARVCMRPLAPGSRNPPPPPPHTPSPPPMPPPPPPREVPVECKRTEGGCPCRSTWLYNGLFYSFCASPTGTAPLICRVDATSCPSFDPGRPYQPCAAGLTAGLCGGGGRIRISNSLRPPDAMPPSPPPPPPTPPSPPRAPSPSPSPAAPPTPAAPPPSPPAHPSSGAVASMSGSISVDAPSACSAPQPSPQPLYKAPSLTDAAADLAGELAVLAAVPADFVRVDSVGCVSELPLLVVTYTIFLPASPSVAGQLANISMRSSSTAAMRAAISPAFQARWGEVYESSYIVTVVLQPLAVAAGGPFFWQRPRGYTSGLATALLPTGDAGLVCTASGFRATEAAMICQQLGFLDGEPVGPPESATDPYGPELVLMDGLACVDAVARPDRGEPQCAFSGWVASDGRCNASTVAAVACSGGVIATLDAQVTLLSPGCAAAASVASGLLLLELFQALEALFPAGRSLLLARGPVVCGEADGAEASSSAAGAAKAGESQDLGITVSYSVQLLVGSSSSDVDAAWNASSSVDAIRGALGPALTERWGQVASASALGLYAVNLETLCSAPKGAVALVCTGRPPPQAAAALTSGAAPNPLANPSAASASLVTPAGAARRDGTGLDRVEKLVITLGSVIGMALVVLIILGVVLYRRRLRNGSRVRPSTPPLRAQTRTGGWGEPESAPGYPLTVTATATAADVCTTRGAHGGPAGVPPPPAQPSAPALDATAPLRPPSRVRDSASLTASVGTAPAAPGPEGAAQRAEPGAFASGSSAGQETRQAMPAAAPQLLSPPAPAPSRRRRLAPLRAGGDNSGGGTPELLAAGSALAGEPRGEMNELPERGRQAAAPPGLLEGGVPYNPHGSPRTEHLRTPQQHPAIP